MSKLKKILTDNGFDTLVSVNEFIRESKSLKDVKYYNELLSKKIKIEDFIKYDLDGNVVLNSKILFKGFGVDKKLSTKEKKIAKLGNTRVYFHYKNSPVIYGKVVVYDESNYNDLAEYFKNKLKLKI